MLCTTPFSNKDQRQPAFVTRGANEELTTVNHELRGRNHEITQANNDLNNLLTSIDVALVMLGSDVAIRRFTPEAQKLLGLIPADNEGLTTAARVPRNLEPS